MTDLVKDLRNSGWYLAKPAADRIEKDAQHIDEMYALVAAMNADHTVNKNHIEKLEAALRAIVDEEVPREVAISYRDDGILSKHDKCAHHEWMYNHCPYCIMEYAEKKLGEVNAP